MKTTIDMAREVFDIETDHRGRETFSSDSYGLEDFAALVRADEREACAKVCEAHQFASIGLAAAIRNRGNK
jgi:hypothetical protein